MIRPLLLLLGLLVLLYIAFTIYLAFVLRWEDQRTRGIAYYGQPPRARAAYRRSLRLHAALLAPLLWVNSKLAKVDFRRVRIQHKGVSFPAGSCDAESVARAESYQPRPADVFVATQMKCGTTWMEHIVYEVLLRGRGNLVENGTTLYAIAPWLEGRRSVSLDDAPLLGTERPSRIIKTHLPASLCPRGDDARFIYVARHPVSCFASCVDFIATNTGAMAPPLEASEAWFRSADLMWWGTWPDHVKGWWARSRADANVLFVHFEEMKRDLAGVVRRVATFLGMAPLTDGELADVVRKCGFAYMQEHQDAFEMQPPHLLQTNAALFVSGTADRHKDVPEAMKQRISAWAAEEMRDSDYPLATNYPDVTKAS